MSGFNENNRYRFTVFDSMSTKELEEILRQDSQFLQNNEYDMAAIIYVSELIAKREKENPSGKFTDVNKAWKSFMEDYYPISDDEITSDFSDQFSEINKNKNTISTYPKIIPKKRKNSSHLLTRAASVAAIISVILLVGTVTAYAMGFNLWSVIAQWTDETFNFAPSKQIEEPEIKYKPQLEYNSLSEALTANDIRVPLVPKWMPEGFEQTELKVHCQPFVSFCATYSCEDKIIYININQNYCNDMNTYQKDGEPVTELVDSGITHYIMSNLELNKVIWINGSFECSISGDISKEELEKMIRSIYEGDDK